MRHAIRAAMGLILMLGLPGAPAGEDFDPARPETWILPAPDLYAVAAREEHAWVVGYWGAVRRSTDSGTTWSPVATPTRDTLFDVAFADDRHGWIVGENGTVLRSRDGGRSWERQAIRVPDGSGELRPLDVHLFGVSAISRSEAWAVGDLGIVLHVRDGQSWQLRLIPAEAFADEEVPDRIFNAVDFPDRLHGWIVGEFGTVLRTSDGGETWAGERRFEDAPADLYLFDVSALDGRRAAVVGLAGTLLLTEDGGVTWRSQRLPTVSPLYGIDWSDSLATMVGNRGEMFTSSDRGATWRSPRKPRFFNWLAAVTRSDGLLYAVGEQGLILRSEDGGESWSQRHGREPPPFSGVSVPEPGASRELGREQPRVPILPRER